MTQIDISDDTLKQLTELAQVFGEKSTGLKTLSGILAAVIDRYHNAYTVNDGRLPDGWMLNEGLTLADLELYYEFYEAEKGGNAWAERGRAIRSAILAGWLHGDGLSKESAGTLRPAQATAVKNALDTLYVKLVTEDPN